MYNTLSAFYTDDKVWGAFKTALMFERTNECGEIICEHCGKPITMSRDCIGHHKIPLTLQNVNDASISLNPNNVQLVHFRCHNDIHNRYGVYTRHVYLVFGCPLAGRKTFVKERADIHDLVIDIDKIYECITFNPPYIKSNRLYENMRAVESALLDCVKHKRGKWVNAFIIGGKDYAYKGARERFCVEYGAEPIYIECDKDTAMARLASMQDGRDVAEWSKYIDTYFDKLQL